MLTVFKRSGSIFIFSVHTASQNISFGGFESILIFLIKVQFSQTYHSAGLQTLGVKVFFKQLNKNYFPEFQVILVVCLNKEPRESKNNFHNELNPTNYFYLRLGLSCNTIILSVVLYGCETWSLKLREEFRLRVFENMILRRIFGPSGEGSTMRNFIVCTVHLI